MPIASYLKRKYEKSNYAKPINLSCALSSQDAEKRSHVTVVTKRTHMTKGTRVCPKTNSANSACEGVKDKLQFSWGRYSQTL